MYSSGKPMCRYVFFKAYTIVHSRVQFTAAFYINAYRIRLVVAYM